MKTIEAAPSGRLVGLMGGWGIALWVLLNAGMVNAQDKTSTVMENKALIRNGFDQWAAATGNFFDLLADDMQWTITGSTPLSKTYMGKKQFMDEVITPLNDRLSKKIVPSLRELYADGDVVIALWDGQATATDGKPYNASYCWTMQVQHGRIIRVVAFLDGIEFADIMSRIALPK
ncbi:nuclear transport factor 2 family protein [Spirosoma soli]|uniref:Nuclear transport factor 2 family protein n=1 Tax=Spirosoma soli TaxID=1770529 RepID=A0ABW5M4N7_9BACT